MKHLNQKLVSVSLHKLYINEINALYMFGGQLFFFLETTFFDGHMTQFKTQQRNNKLTPYFTTALNNYIICTSKYVLQK